MNRDTLEALSLGSLILFWSSLVSILYWDQPYKGVIVGAGLVAIITGYAYLKQLYEKIKARR